MVLRRVKIYGGTKNKIGSMSIRKSIGPHAHSGRKLETFSGEKKEEDLIIKEYQEGLSVRVPGRQYNHPLRVHSLALTLYIHGQYAQSPYSPYTH